MAYIETPRTDAGNATFMTNGRNLEDFSVENSLLSPIKNREDVIALMRNERGAPVRTPKARFPLTNRRNLPALPNKAEFTPLLQSVHKNNLQRNGKRKSGPETPAFLKNGADKNQSPALPAADGSLIYGSDFGSSVVGDHGSTPIPQIQSSSAQSTPLAALPKRDATGIINDQGNLLTLREQENIIDKIEKENFGLKLKIHFLEDALRRSGPGFNEAALKENTDIKVDRILLQKELGRCKKTLTQAERDIEAYKRHLEEAQAKAKQQHADESLRRELEHMKFALQEKEEENAELRQQIDERHDENEDLQKLKDDVEDLQADIRNKDQQIEDREDEVDRVRSEAKKTSDELDEICAELEEEKRRVQELEDSLQSKAKDTEMLEQVQQDLEDAIDARTKAENDLDELRDEMSDKSFTTKGLNRQLEEKRERLQSELDDLREEHSSLQASFEEKSALARKLESELQDRDRSAESQGQSLQGQEERLRLSHETTKQRCASLESQLQQAIQDLQNKGEEKDLLHSRHDALTAESQALHKDLTKAHQQIDELEINLRQEKVHAEENERHLQSETKEQVDSLAEEVNSLQRRLDEHQGHFTTEKDVLEEQILDLQSQKAKAEEQAAGLQRTIGKLQETEGTLSGNEMKLQEALESEKQRHQDEEAVLQARIQDLKDDRDDKRSELEELQADMSQAKEDLRVSEKEQASLEVKVQELEDEVEVLQSELEGEAAVKARQRLEAAEEEAEDLHNQLIETQQKLDELGTANQGPAQESRELRDTLERTEADLQAVRNERQVLQDRQASTTLDLRQTQTALAVAESERDEIKIKLEQQSTQANDTLKLDQERLNLRTAKLRLEADIGNLRNDKDILDEKLAMVEQQLEAEITRSSEDKARLRRTISDLEQRRSSLRPAGGQYELDSARESVQSLEGQLKTLRDELAAARQKEERHHRMETDQKQALHDLKSKVTHLERLSREAEIARLSNQSPASSAGSSARKSEIDELQRQLTDSQRALRELRSSVKAESKITQDRLREAERRASVDGESFDAQREQLESALAAVRHEHETLQAKHNSASSTITRLRTRISSLEQNLKDRRQNVVLDETIAEERADLHEMLKDAKLEAEDLQTQLSAREGSMQAVQAKEKELRSQLRRVREERDLQGQKTGALVTELDTLQSRYERTINKLSHCQRQWDDEKRAIMSKVRFANVDTSSLHEPKQLDKTAKRHEKELRGLGKQILWLRARCKREEGFRRGLVMEKKYLGMQVAMFEACNKADLDLLRAIGVDPSSSSSQSPNPNPNIQARLKLGGAILRRQTSTTNAARQSGSGRGTPLSLKGVANAIIAVHRMRKSAREWAEQKRLKEELEKKVLGMKAEKEGGKRKRGGRV